LLQKQFPLAKTALTVSPKFFSIIHCRELTATVMVMQVQVHTLLSVKQIAQKSSSEWCRISWRSVYKS